MPNELWIWLGIVVCLSQSGMLSGLNLAVFSLSRLRLEAAADAGDARARIVLALRRDANYTLAAILWGNVAVNVLLTLLADSVLVGTVAFIFSTVFITLVGEILPQAYFSRHALKTGALLAPVLRFYRLLLWPVARPVGLLLDRLVGQEAIPWFREEELTAILQHHARQASGEVGSIEATGAINFLALDDIEVGHEGEPIAPDSIVRLPFRDDAPVFPAGWQDRDSDFLQRIASSGRKWIVVIDPSGEPRRILSAPALLSQAFVGRADFDPADVCHRPLIIRDVRTTLGTVLNRLTVEPERPGDDVIDVDAFIVWTEHDRRIITGSDILGRLLRQIAKSTR